MGSPLKIKEKPAAPVEKKSDTGLGKARRERGEKENGRYTHYCDALRVQQRKSENNERAWLRSNKGRTPPAEPCEKADATPTRCYYVCSSAWARGLCAHNLACAGHVTGRQRARHNTFEDVPLRTRHLAIYIPARYGIHCKGKHS